MKKLNVIPTPEEVEMLGGTVNAAVLDRLTKQTDETGTYGDEGYAIEIDDTGVTVTAKTDCGFFRAEQTLKQLKTGAEVPCLRITDRPAFAYRGFLIDSARHMQSVDELKKLIDAAALFKFNKMHWHLSDDQGFRIESERFPLLNSVGSYRDSSDFGGEHIKERYGGFYTREQIRGLVAYCAERHIEVIPELDVPGHATALIAAYPALSCRRLAIPLETKQGIFNNLLCAGNENTFDFLFELLDEISELFPSKYIHLGGDEAPKTYWEKCPKCRARKEELGLKNYDELQGWFTNRLIARLAEKGKQVIVWNESLNGNNLDESATVQMWMDRRGKSAVWANRGSSVIACPFSYYYCDYPYSMTPVKKTYEYDPVFEGVAPIMKKHVIGVTVPLWTEYISDFDRLCYMAFPRFAAVAERGWTKPDNLDYESFCRRFAAVTPLLHRLGVKPAPQSDWDPNTLNRLTKTIRFFKDKIDPQTIKNSLNSTNRQE
ncbi:MAG: beta-N-acetylhexosaminidase [Clostridia bacterium]|nr:beta-N-acetylhexosaminidase [Clostridia bacterium]